MREARDREAAVFSEVAQEKKKGDRVGPARKTDEHTRAWRAQGVALDGLSDALVKRGCQRDMPEGRLELPTPRL